MDDGVNVVSGGGAVQLYAGLPMLCCVTMRGNIDRQVLELPAYTVRETAHYLTIPSASRQLLYGPGWLGDLNQQNPEADFSAQF